MILKGDDIVYHLIGGNDAGFGLFEIGKKSGIITIKNPLSASSQEFFNVI